LVHYCAEVEGSAPGAGVERCSFVLRYWFWLESPCSSGRFRSEDFDFVSFDTRFSFEFPFAIFSLVDSLGDVVVVDVVEGVTFNNSLDNLAVVEDVDVEGG